MALNLSYIVNKILPVRTIGTGQKYVTRTGSLAISTEETVLDTKKPIVVDYAEFVTDSIEKTLLRIQQYQGSTLTPLTLLTYAGTTTGFSVGNVNRDSSAFVRIELFDTTNNRYKISVTNMSFPEGAKISVVNNDTESAKVAGCIVRYREV